MLKWFNREKTTPTDHSVIQLFGYSVISPISPRHSVIRLFGYSVIRKSHSAFTIVELLVVLGVIAVLMGIVTTAASESIKASRSRRADALCTLVQSGLAAYYAQHDEWPISFKGKSNSNNEGANNNSDDDKYVLTGTEVRQCVKALVDAAKKGNPLMDISGLWVSRQDGELPGGSNGKGGIGENKVERKVKPAYGMGFMDAVRGTKWSKKKMKTAEMYFGYPDANTGYFLRFKMVYSISADQLTVGKQ